MNYDKWKKLISQLNDDNDLNDQNIINKIKENLQKIDDDTYQEWKNNKFNLSHRFKFNKDSKFENLSLLFILNNLYTIQTNAKVTDALLKAETQEKKDTKLWSAISSNDSEKVKLAIEDGANPNTVDEKMCTPLHYAILNKNITLAKTLIDNGANPNVRDDCNFSPFYYATMNNSIDLVEILIQNGVDPNTLHNNGMTSLHYAVLKGNIKLVKTLINSRVDVNTLTSNRNTPLACAIKNGNKEIVVFLLKNGAHVNTKDIEGNTPLHHAVNSGNIDIINLLLKRDIMIDATNINGETPLQYAASKEKIEIVNALLRAGADVNYPNIKGMICLHHAIKSDNAELINLLIKKGAKINIRTKIGATLLHYAAKYNSENAINILLENRTDPEIISSYKNFGDNPVTPLQLAIMLGNKKAVEALLKVENNINRLSNFYYRLIPSIPLKLTYLHLAAKHGHAEIIEALIEKEANFNAKDTEGNTPLLYAISEGNTKSIAILIEKGANLNIKNNNRHSFIDFLRSSHPVNEKTIKVIKTLIECNALKNFNTRKLNKFINNHPDHRFRSSMIEYKKQCFNEVIRMKETKVNENMCITYYDMLVRYQSSNLLSYTQNINILKELEKGDYKEIFPIYSSRIERFSQKLPERLRLLKQGEKNLYDLLLYCYNKYLGDVSMNIAEYLTNDDIENLNNAINSIIKENKRGTKRKAEMNENQEESYKRLAFSNDNELPTCSISNVNTESVNQNSIQQIH